MRKRLVDREMAFSVMFLGKIPIFVKWVGGLKLAAGLQTRIQYGEKERLY